LVSLAIVRNYALLALLALYASFSMIERNMNIEAIDISGAFSILEVVCFDVIFIQFL